MTGVVAVTIDVAITSVAVVAPAGTVTLAGTDIQQAGTEPTTQASIYNVVSSGNFTVDITGTGALHNNADSSSTDTSDSPPLTEGRPQIYTHLTLLIVLTFSILGVGLILLFRTKKGTESLKS